MHVAGTNNYVTADGSIHHNSGKTHALILRLLGLLGAGQTCAYYMPTYGLIHDLGIPRLLAIVEGEFGIRARARLVGGRPQVDIPGIGRVIFRSMDAPESIIGYEVVDSFFDELDTLPTDKAAQVWRLGLARNRAKRRAPIVGMPPNTMSVATTPEGFRFVYEQWGRDVAKAEATGYVIYRGRTMDNPELDPAYVETLRASYPSALLRAYLEGEFVNLKDAGMHREWLRPGVAPEGCTVVMGVDLALSQKDGADYTAAVVLARAPDGALTVLDVQRTRAPFHQVLNFVRAVAERHRPSAIAIEAVQYQAAVVQELLRTTTLPVRGVKPDKDKMTRFLPLQARYEQGQVGHTPGLIPEFEDELLSFPVGAHDDMVDALAYAFAALPATGPQIATAGHRTFGGSHVAFPSAL